MPGKAQTRTRNYATVIYPESAPSDWKERLSNTHVAALFRRYTTRILTQTARRRRPIIMCLSCLMGLKQSLKQKRFLTG